MLHQAADLPQVVAMDVREVVAVIRVVAVPEAYADTLRIDVVGNQSVGTLGIAGRGSNFDCAGDSRNLWRGQVGLPDPKVAQVIIVKVVGQVRRDIGGQADNQIPWLLGPTRGCRYLSQSVAGKKTADICLHSRGAGEIVDAVAAHQVPVLTKVVIHTGHAEIRPHRRCNRARKPKSVVPVSCLCIGRVGHVFRPQILNRRIEP